ncbi:hypothetical protein, partial [Xenorhabdus bovienii]
WSGNTIKKQHVTRRGLNATEPKEDVEYNNLDIDHGMGMVAAMEFRDYGYHETADSEVVKNTYGSAFLKFNPEEKQWQLHYQKLAAAPNIM